MHKWTHHKVHCTENSSSSFFWKKETKIQNDEKEEPIVSHV